MSHNKAEARGAGAEMFPFVKYVLAVIENDSGAMEHEAQSATGEPFEYRVRILEIQTAGFNGQLAKARQIASRAMDHKISSAPALVAAVALAEAVFGLESQARTRARRALRLDRGRRTAATSAFTLALAHEPAAAESVLNELLRKYPNDTLLNAVWVPAVHGAIALRGNDAHRAITAAENPSYLAAYAWPPYIRGLAYLRLGLASKAAAEFRAILERKGGLFNTAF